MKKKHLFIVSFLVLTLFLSTTLSTFGANKIATNYRVFTGTVPDFGVLVAWGVNFELKAYFNTSSSQYYLTEIRTSAYIDPKRGDISNGYLTHSVDERIDYGSITSRRVAPAPISFWTFPAIIIPTTALSYYYAEGNPNKYFMYEAEETGYSYFAVTGAIIHNPNHTLSLVVSGPK